MIYPPKQLIHPGHPEHAIELRFEGWLYRCDGCKELGFGERYMCTEPFSSCDYHLHKDCALHSETISHHPFFRHCVFHFLLSPVDKNRYCDGCGLDIMGFNYHCFDEGLDLHPCCAALEERMQEGELRFRLCRKMSSKCNECGHKKLGREGQRASWGYVSDCGECHLHVACVKRLLLKNWEKERLGSDKEARSDETALVMRKEPRLEIVIDKSKGRSSGKYGKLKKILKIALTFIMAAVVGDPTALVIGLLSSLVTR